MQGLGLEHGEQCASQGCNLLVLTSRSGSVSKDVLSRLADTGSTIFALRADSTSAESTAEVIEWTRSALPCIDHYAHAAGASGFAMLADMSVAEFRRVTSTKVRNVAVEQTSPQSQHAYVYLCRLPPLPPSNGQQCRCNQTWHFPRHQQFGAKLVVLTILPATLS